MTLWKYYSVCAADLFALYLTCNISVSVALSLCIAGCHFSGVRIEVGQFAGEPGGAAKLDTACPRHIVDSVTRGKH